MRVHHGKSQALLALLGAAFALPSGSAKAFALAFALALCLPAPALALGSAGPLGATGLQEQESVECNQRKSVGSGR